MPAAGVQLPPLDLLEEPEHGDVLVVGRGALPAKQAVAVHTQTRPAEMFAQQQFRLNRRGPEAGREGEILGIGAGKHRAQAQSQRRRPKRLIVDWGWLLSRSFLEQLIP